MSIYIPNNAKEYLCTFLFDSIFPSRLDIKGDAEFLPIYTAVTSFCIWISLPRDVFMVNFKLRLTSVKFVQCAI